jgi:putative ABC transport system ATP-binding protein
MKRNERLQKAKEWIKEVGLQGLEHRKPAELSGGQQQRVAVARAMVTEPKIVFADEPTANLDAATAEMLLQLFQRLNEINGTTFIFSSHDPRVIKFADRVITLTDGKVVGPDDLN